MRRVEVAVPGAAYPVLIGGGALDELRSHLGPAAVAVADRAVDLDLGIPTLRLEGGEGAKTMEVLGQVLAFLEEHRVGRDGTLVAIGGGTVGDLAGFAASVWLRGVGLVHVPTTLLAMVDSSIGGKTGVNTERAKNAVGTFWQPRAVLIDPAFLRTLPQEQIDGGHAEVVKYAMTLDPGIAGLTEIEDVIERCVRCKAAVVARDERESGGREVLNYGHTVAHAIESASGYTVHHGRAVAAGMGVAIRISAGLGLCEPSLIQTQDELLAAHGLPGPLPYLRVEQVMAATAGDKKSRAGRLRWVLLRGMGRAETGLEAPDELVRDAVAEILARS